MTSTLEKDQSCFTIFVEGNIGSGKSSLLNHLADYDIEICTEPINLWKNFHGSNVLQLFYDDPKKWSFIFQSIVQLTRLDSHLQTSSINTRKLMERSMYSARYCFVEHLHNQGFMSDLEYTIIDEWFKWITSKCKIAGDLIVYLRSDPEVAYGRVLARGRKEEVGITLPYLQSIHKLYEDWLIEKTAFACPHPVLVINANGSQEEIVEEFKRKQPDF